MDIIMAQRLAIMQQAIHLPRHLLIVVGVQFQSSLRDSRGSNRERGLGVGGGHSKKNDRESACEANCFCKSHSHSFRYHTILLSLELTTYTPATYVLLLAW